MHKAIARDTFFIFFFFCATYDQLLVAMQKMQMQEFEMGELAPVSQEHPTPQNLAILTIPDNQAPDASPVSQMPCTPSSPVRTWQEEVTFAVAVLVMERNELDNFVQSTKNWAWMQNRLTQRAGKKTACLDLFHNLGCLGLEELSRENSGQSQQQATIDPESHTTAVSSPPQPALRRTTSCTWSNSNAPQPS